MIKDSNPNIYKAVLKYNPKQTANPIKIWVKDLNIHLTNKEM